MADADTQLKAVLHELDSVQGGVNRTYTAIYGVFGFVLPALVGVFTFAAKDLHLSDPTVPQVALMFIIVFSLSGLWAQSLWMELLRYIRYRYIVLLPRLYALAGFDDKPNYLQWSGPRSLQNSAPILLFNAGSWLTLLIIHVVFVARSGLLLQACSALFIIAVTVANVAVMREADQVERAIAASAAAKLTSA